MIKNLDLIHKSGVDVRSIDQTYDGSVDLQKNTLNIKIFR